jgi:transposase
MDRQYVGIDFHRRRSVIVRLNVAGERLAVVKVDNNAVAFAAAMADAGDAPEVVIEATYGWYWVVDLLQELGATVHLANPQALNWGDRRVKNDVVDATDLADMLRLNRLPEAWIAPPVLRELRELVRYRAKLVKLRAGLKAQVHAVMAKEGVLPIADDMFTLKGNKALDAMELGRNYAIRVASLRELIVHYDREVTMLERDIHTHLRGHRGYHAIQKINGVGRVTAAVAVAEIGDVERFPNPDALCCWVGLTPKHRESDVKAHRREISKQGSRLLRWALIEAAPHAARDSHDRERYERIRQRLGRQPGAKVARLDIARQLAEAIWHVLTKNEPFAPAGPAIYLVA